MNRLYYIGPLYWILRDTGKPKDKIFAVGFMRQTAPPWKVGRGPQIRFGKYVLQVGVARNTKVESETSGLLSAMTGRFMDTKPSDIGDWR